MEEYNNVCQFMSSMAGRGGPKVSFDYTCFWQIWRAIMFSKTG